MATMTQQELRAGPAPDDDDELYEEEPRRHSWGAIMSVVLALVLAFVAYQWHQVAGRERDLAAQVGTLRAEAETQRLRAEDAQRQVAEAQKRLVQLGSERDSLNERVAVLEKAGRVTAAAKAGSPKPTATPVAATKTTSPTKKTR